MLFYHLSTLIACHLQENWDMPEPFAILSLALNGDVLGQRAFTHTVVLECSHNSSPQGLGPCWVPPSDLSKG